MIIAPLLLAISQFFWENGMLGATAGWLQVLAFTFWIIAFQGMFASLKGIYPLYASLGLLAATYACIGGAGFGYDGIYSEAMGVFSKAESIAVHHEVGLPLTIALFIPGILFPLSLLLLSVQLIRAKKLQTWVGVLLLVAAIGFPLSRIPRIDLIAHIDNAILLLTHILIAVSLQPMDRGRD